MPLNIDFCRAWREAQFIVPHQVCDMFAQGDFEQMIKTVEAMEAAKFYEASEARIKLSRVKTAMANVLQHNHTNVSRLCLRKSS